MTLIKTNRRGPPGAVRSKKQNKDENLNSLSKDLDECDSSQTKTSYFQVPEFPFWKSENWKRYPAQFLPHNQPQAHSHLTI